MNLSCLAMLCGWIACNIAWWTGYLCHSSQKFSAFSLGMSLVVGVFTGIVIVCAWFFVFLPVDLMIPDASPLRRPGAAAAFGFLVSFALVVAFALARMSPRSIQIYGLVDAVWNALGAGALPYTLGTCATGTVAGWTRALMDKPNRSPMP